LTFCKNNQELSCKTRETNAKIRIVDGRKIAMKPGKHKFKDGSSLEILENGGYVLRETYTPNRVLVARETSPINYNDPPPPLPPGVTDPDSDDSEPGLGK
jgi:hypothetical protein